MRSSLCYRFFLFNVIFLMFWIHVHMKTVLELSSFYEVALAERENLVMKYGHYEAPTPHCLMGMKNS